MDMLFEVLSGVPDIITHAKFMFKSVNWFLGGSIPNSAISFTYSNNSYNILHYWADFDTYSHI